MKQLLIDLCACDELKEWAEDKTWEQVYNSCHRGDWLLWLFAKTNPDDLQRLSLVKGYCANTVRYLMKDKRSIRAIDIAIAFGEGKAIIDELRNAAADADTVAFDLYVYATSSSSAAAYAAIAASAAASFYADISVCANAATGYAAHAVYLDLDADARKQNWQITADICRKYLPIEIWNIK
jgi:hypothetical protein